jgi:parallel beta-helix repeat protein
MISSRSRGARAEHVYCRKAATFKKSCGLKEESLKTGIIGTGVSLLLACGSCQLALAATWCVNSGGTSGCASSIGAAVSAASAGDTINVAHGTYKEQVSIGKSLFLIGQEASNTVIDATGKVNGITITNTSQVVVTGFTVENADAAGIWITGSSFVTISANNVVHNDLALIPGANASCPPLIGTPFEQGEAEDCGEGIYLSHVDHSVLSNNVVTQNAGGILIADDTGPTHDNQVIGNSVVRNTQLDCGITLPSHNPVSGGVYHNLIADNDSMYNGGPGVGIFAPIPGSKAYGNIVRNNRLIGNGLPGVTMHNHVPNGTPGFPPFPAVFNDNQIIGNVISDNSQDFEDAATSGPTGINIYSVSPMSGTLISGNIIDRETLDIAIKIPPLSGGQPAVVIQFNNLNGNQHDSGVENSNGTIINATMNWWGCPKGPGAPGCTAVSGSGVQWTPWLTNPIQANK